MKTRSLIQEFLDQKRFALIGVSRDPGNFTRRLFGEFTGRGYEAIPVNPHTLEINGVRCYASIKDIQPRVTSALILTPKRIRKDILMECADAGVTLVWVHGVAGVEEIDEDCVALCGKYGMAIVPGYCPYMFMPWSSFVHRAHGFIEKMIGRYPS